MITMEETAVFMGQGSQSAIGQRGTPSIYIPSTVYESARIACISKIRLNRSKDPPLIITKIKKDKIEGDGGVCVLEIDKGIVNEVDRFLAANYFAKRPKLSDSLRSKQHPSHKRR